MQILDVSGAVRLIYTRR